MTSKSAVLIVNFLLTKQTLTFKLQSQTALLDYMAIFLEFLSVQGLLTDIFDI